VAVSAYDGAKRVGSISIDRKSGRTREAARTGRLPPALQPCAFRADCDAPRTRFLAHWQPGLPITGADRRCQRQPTTAAGSKPRSGGHGRRGASLAV
jgi:hypothetical protein